MMRALRTLTPVLATAAVLAPAAPAGASDLGPVGSGHWHGVANGNTLEVVYDCEGVAPGATAVTMWCTINGATQSTSLPGEGNVLAGVATVPLGPVQLCWKVTAIYPDATEKTVTGCAAQSVGVGG
jgi:hypothetical protein